MCRVQSSAEGLPRVELKVCRGAVKQEDAKAEIGRGIRPAPASAQSPGHPAPSSSSVDQPSPSPASPPSTADGPTSSARARVVTAGGGGCGACGPSAAAHRRAGGRARVPRGAACRPVLGSRAGQEGEGLPWLAGEGCGGRRAGDGADRHRAVPGGAGRAEACRQPPHVRPTARRRRPRHSRYRPWPPQSPPRNLLRLRGASRGSIAKSRIILCIFALVSVLCVSRVSPASSRFLLYISCCFVEDSDTQK